ncbi:hypothetical protein OC842_004538 [Tilletia horrida]|uniref:RCC1-like domain-containing protein n=1 Tax=Tilletia horrida TaxID=155126 RepID=A0AAN6GE57_9BASI|nr:hypothetical protein OC842_004538 [Tilletia horrida]
MPPRQAAAAAAAAKETKTAAAKRKRESGGSDDAPEASEHHQNGDTKAAAETKAPAARGRKKRASTAEPETVSASSSQRDEGVAASGAATAAAAAAPPAPKRARRSSITSDAGSVASTGSRGRRSLRGGLVPHAPRMGMNPLPRPLPQLPPNALATHTAAALSNAATAFSASASAAVNGSSSDNASTPLARYLLIWGSADSGQLGLGPDVTDEIPRPKLHQPLADAILAGNSWAREGIETAVAGGMHTLAIDASGTLWSWGVNDNAALGRQTARDPNIPSDVSESTPHRVEGLGPKGRGIDPKTGKEADVTPFRATRIVAADCASVALSDTGELRCWGSFRSNEGLLGFESLQGASKMQYAPVAIPALSRHSFSAVAAGENHFLALTTEGIVFAWGNGEQAQLGRKIMARRKLNALTPEKVGIKKVRLIGSGAYHSFAVDNSESAWVWGLNMRHQSGLNLAHGDLIETPTMIPALSRAHKNCKLPEGVTIVQIAAGSAHSLFLLSNGEVWGCGRSDGGEIGLADDHEVMRDIKTKKDEWKAERSKELEEEMKVWQQQMAERQAASNGNAGAFQLGEGAVANVDDLPPTLGAPPDEYVGIPTKIPFPEEEGSSSPTQIVQISCGARFSMAVTSTGKLYAWGTGPSCELGLGADEEMVTVPTLVRSVEFKKKGWVPIAVSAGGQHCVALAVNPAGDAAITGAAPAAAPAS